MVHYIPPSHCTYIFIKTTQCSPYTFTFLLFFFHFLPTLESFKNGLRFGIRGANYLLFHESLWSKMNFVYFTDATAATNSAQNASRYDKSHTKCVVLVIIVNGCSYYSGSFSSRDFLALRQIVVDRYIKTLSYVQFRKVVQSGMPRPGRRRRW